MATKSIRCYNQCNVHWTKRHATMLQMESKVDWGKFYRQQVQQCGDLLLTSGLAIKGIAGSAATGCTMERASKEHCPCDSIHVSRKGRRGWWIPGHSSNNDRYLAELMTLLDQSLASEFTFTLMLVTEALLTQQFVKLLKGPGNKLSGVPRFAFP